MKNDYAVGQTIYYYFFSMDENKKIEKKIETFKIITMNDNFIVIDDNMFTKFANDKTWEKSYGELDKCHVSKWKLISSYPEELRVNLYSTNPSIKINQNRMRRALSNYIDKNYWYVQNRGELLNSLKFDWRSYEIDIYRRLAY